MMYYRGLPLGTRAPTPCPDCQSGLLLIIGPGDRLRYQCEKIECEGNASANRRTGELYGVPVNKYGRWLRYHLHSLFNQYVDQIPVQHKLERDALMSEIYQYMNLQVFVLPEFHTAYMNVPQLEEAIRVAETSLPGFMKWIGYGLPEKESTHAASFGTKDIQHHVGSDIQA